MSPLFSIEVNGIRYSFVDDYCNSKHPLPGSDLTFPLTSGMRSYCKVACSDCIFSGKGRACHSPIAKSPYLLYALKPYFDLENDYPEYLI